MSAAAGDQLSGALPSGLSELLLSRTGTLVGAAREVIAVLSVAGRPMDEGELVGGCRRKWLTMSTDDVCGPTLASSMATVL